MRLIYKSRFNNLTKTQVEKTLGRPSVWHYNGDSAKGDWNKEGITLYFKDGKCVKMELDMKKIKGAKA